MIDIAEVKNKVVTVEALKALHDYNEATYETKENTNTRIVPVANGGTNATDGSTGLKNLLADGSMVLSSYQFGDELPEPGTPGRIFFKRLVE